ncbi:MAG: hypothetical protein NVSMB19_20850 [Vulcanimicrobiaceae bacterium]
MVPYGKMLRSASRLAFPIGLALLALGGATLARASVAATGDGERASLVPSAAPALLGPINELGRNGWQCAAERAATTMRPAEADLPQATAPEDGR